MRSFQSAKLFDIEITKITQNVCLNAQVVARSASETHSAFEALDSAVRVFVFTA